MKSGAKLALCYLVGGHEILEPIFLLDWNTGLCRDVLDVHNKIQDGTNHQEGLPIVSQVTQNQPTNPPSESESHLNCEESAEWMWGFDEQMSFRYAFDGQLEGFFKYGDSPENALKNSTYADEVAKAAVNRRKKYLPRRLPRTVSSTNVSSEGIMESEPADEPAVDQVDLPSSQPNDKTCISGDDGNTEQSRSTDEQTTRWSASPCFEPVVEKPSIGCKNSLDPQRIDCLTDAILSNFCAAAEQISVSGQDDSHSTCSVPGESLATPANSVLSTVTPGSGGTTGSSLTALIQMCSEAGGGLENRRSVRQRRTITRDISKKLEGTPGKKDVFPGELAGARMSSSEESAGPVTSQDGDSLFERPVETSTTSSSCQLSQASDCNYSVPLTFEGEERATPSLIPTYSAVSRHVTSSDITVTSPVFSNYSSSSSIPHTSEGEERARPSLIPTYSAFNGHVTSSDITATPPVFSNYSSSSSSCSMNSFVRLTSSDTTATPLVFNICSNSSSSSLNSFVNNTVSKSPTTTYLCKTGSTAVTRANPYIEEPFPVIVDTFSGYYIVNGNNSGQRQENKQQGYRPIVPAPNQSVNVCSEEPASDASVTSGCCGKNIPYPIIVDSFSINENFRAAVAHRSFKYKILESQRQANSVSHLTPQQTSPPPQVNRGHFSSPYLNQTSQSGYIALDNTVLMKAFSLEKFYSFSAPAEKQTQAPCLRPQTRCYKTTRTNFSRMSLEPICSVIHPLTGSPRQSTYQKSATEVANQRAWGWQI